MIQVEGLTKMIQKKEILTDISFSAKNGDCVALIGPNGAGKTTLMQCLIGDKFPTKGRIHIHGADPTNKKAMVDVAILPQENTIGGSELKVKEMLSFFRSIYPNPLSNEEIDQLLQFTPEKKSQRINKLSGGQRRLFAFVVTLIGRPKLLFLDEPTAAMDTSTRQRFWEIVDDLKQKGVTIVYSSHYIEEVEHTADRILVLHKGRLLRDTTPHKMQSEEREKEFSLPLSYQELVESFDWIDKVRTTYDTVSFITQEVQKTFDALQKAGCSIEEMEIKNKTLLNSLFDTTKEDE